MKLLFIEAGTKYKKSKNGHIYTDGNFDSKIWDRYKAYCDKLEIIGRVDSKTYEEIDAEKKFNIVNKDISNIVLLEDIYSSKFNFLNIKKRIKIVNQIENEIIKNDFIIIRSLTKFYTFKAAQLCRKHKKDYLIEVTGSALDSLWYRGDIYGKLLAIPTELKKKFEIKKAQNVLYVTNTFLQQEYPNANKNIGCSDVEIVVDEEIAKQKLFNYEKLNVQNDIIKIGTLGPVDSELKGQKDVIKAIFLLKKQGINNIRYSLVGRGNNKKLKRLVNKLGLQEYIFFEGEKKHEDVFKWLKNVDIYIQPSYTEGLCRSLVEAMSVGCPIITSNVGGNIELVNKEYMFKKGNIKDIICKIQKILSSNEEIIKESHRSLQIASFYNSFSLNKKRDAFYSGVINKM